MAVAPTNHHAERRAGHMTSRRGTQFFQATGSLA